MYSSRHGDFKYSDLQATGNARVQNGNIYNNHTYTSSPSFSNLNLDELNRELLLAAGNNRARSVESLLNRGANPEYKDEHGLTALHHATLSGCEDSVRVLLGKTADVDAHSPLYGTALCLAIIKDRSNIADILLEHRPSVRPRTTGLGTALHCASWAGNCEIASTLLQRGAEVNCAINIVQGRYERLRERGLVDSGNNGTPTTSISLPLSLAVSRAHVEMTKLLLENGALVNDGSGTSNFPLAIAFRMGHVQMAELLISHGANVATEQHKGKLFTMALDQISRNSNRSLLEFLLLSDELVPRSDLVKTLTSIKDLENPSHDEMIATMITAAAQGGDDKVLKLLLSFGANINSRFPDKQTALHRITRAPRTIGTMKLLKLGAQVDACDDRGWTPLMKAVQDGELPLIKLLALCGANVNTQADSGQTAVHMAMKSRDIDVLKVLKQYGADFHLLDRRGNTPLAFSMQGIKFPVARSGQEATSVTFSKFHGSPNTGTAISDTDMQRQTPPLSDQPDIFLGKFLLVVNGDDITAVRLLLHNASTGSINDAWMWACDHIEDGATPSIIEALLDRNAPINATDSEGRTMLHRALNHDNQTIVELLIRWGVDLEQDLVGRGLLGRAVHANNEIFVEFLLRHGANINRTLERKDLTYLHIVIGRWKTHKSLLPVLLKYSPSLQEPAGRTPLTVAIALGIVDAVALLVGAGANIDDKPIRAAIESRNLAMVEVLLRPDVRAGQLEDLLYWTVVRYHSSPVVGSIVKAIVESCVGEETAVSLSTHIDINYADKSGYTALHYLFRAPESQIKICLVPLLEAGANIDAKNARDWTPLHCAAHYGKLYMARILVERGAETLGLTREETTPIDIAKERGHEELVDILEKAKEKKIIKEKAVETARTWDPFLEGHRLAMGGEAKSQVTETKKKKNSWIHRLRNVT